MRWRRRFTICTSYWSRISLRAPSNFHNLVYKGNSGHVCEAVWGSTWWNTLDKMRWRNKQGLRKCVEEIALKNWTRLEEMTLKKWTRLEEMRWRNGVEEMRWRIEHGLMKWCAVRNWTRLDEMVRSGICILVQEELRQWGASMRCVNEVRQCTLRQCTLRQSLCASTLCVSAGRTEHVPE